jgi:23S rRNA (uridine2552-2'-O)-methyltransferase
VDLGAAPGSWAEFAAKVVGPAGLVVAIDLLPIKPIPNVTFYQGDFTDPTIKNKILEHVKNKKVDVVLSDMAPNLSGIDIADQARSIELAESALAFALETLKPNGTFLVKVFQGEDFPAFYKKMQQAFSSVKTIKPEASRSRSKEIYLLAGRLI